MDSADARSAISGNFVRLSNRITEIAGDRQIKLVCVTKYARVEWIEALLLAGASALGENRLPDGLERLGALRDAGYKFESHLLGPLQSRKAALAARFDWYQALSRSKEIPMLAEEREKLPGGSDSSPSPLNVLVQVNIGHEPQKSGASFDQAHELLEQCAGQRLLRPRGLMCIPPAESGFADPAEYERVTRGYFRQMKLGFDRIAARYPELPLDTLSMGMSRDYAWAIEEGATMVRVGSALWKGLEG